MNKKLLLFLSVASFHLFAMDLPITGMPPEIIEKIIIKLIQNKQRLDQAATELRKLEKTDRKFYNSVADVQTMNKILQLLEQKFQSGKIPIAFALQTNGARNWLNNKFKKTKLDFNQLAQFYRQININLLKAIRDNNTDQAIDWLSRGADPNAKIEDPSQWHLLRILFSNGGDPKVARLLLEAGAQIDKRILSSRYIMHIPGEKKDQNRKIILELIEKFQAK